MCPSLSATSIDDRGYETCLSPSRICKSWSYFSTGCDLPNKNAGFCAIFSCNFLCGVVIFASQKSPVLLARSRGGQSRGIFLSGERAASRRETRSPAALSIQPLCVDTELQIQKEDTRTYGKCKEDV